MTHTSTRQSTLHGEHASAAAWSSFGACCGHCAACLVCFGRATTERVCVRARLLARWRSVVSLAGLSDALTALVQQLIVNIEQYCEPRVLFAHVTKLFLLRHGIAQERFVVLAKMSAVERAKYLTTEV